MEDIDAEKHWKNCRKLRAVPQRFRLGDTNYMTLYGHWRFR